MLDLSPIQYFTLQLKGGYEAREQIRRNVDTMALSIMPMENVNPAIIYNEYIPYHMISPFFWSLLWAEDRIYDFLAMQLQKNVINTRNEKIFLLFEEGRRKENFRVIEKKICTTFKYFEGFM